MIFVQLALLAGGCAAGVIASDLLGHRNRGPWPVAVATILLVLLGGLLYSGEILAVALGLGLASAGVTTVGWARKLSANRRRTQEARSAQAAARARQLELRGRD